MDLREELGAVACPTLVLSGTLDPITPVEAAEEIVAAMAAGVATLDVYEGGGHFLHEDDPDRFFARLRAFITGKDGNP